MNVNYLKGQKIEEDDLIPDVEGYGKLDRFNLELKHIAFIAIGFEPLCSRLLHKVTNSISGLREFLPNSIGGKKFVHACAFLGTEGYQIRKGKNSYENYRGILAEFGKYDKSREGDYKSKVYYIGKDGARFTRYDYLDFLDRIKRNNTFMGSQLNKYPIIICKVHYDHNLLTLFAHIFFGINKIHENEPYVWMMELLKSKNNEKYMNQWEKVKYNLITNNCQIFVSKIIDALCATPMNINEVDNYKVHIPISIYESLKGNIYAINDKSFKMINYRRLFIYPYIHSPLIFTGLNFVLFYGQGGRYQDDIKINYDLLSEEFHQLETDEEKISRFKKVLGENGVKGEYNLMRIKKEYRPILLLKGPI
jgi:hypothetical protein